MNIIKQIKQAFRFQVPHGGGEGGLRGGGPACAADHGAALLDRAGEQNKTNKTAQTPKTILINRQVIHE